LRLLAHIAARLRGIEGGGHARLRCRRRLTSSLATGAGLEPAPPVLTVAKNYSRVSYTFFDCVLQSSGATFRRGRTLVLGAQLRGLS
jgi:hypothetical protein